MLMGIFCFILVCVFVSFFETFNLIGGVVAIIAWIGQLSVFTGILVCVAPFILAFVLAKIIKASRK